MYTVWYRKVGSGYECIFCSRFTDYQLAVSVMEALMVEFPGEVQEAWVEQD